MSGYNTNNGHKQSWLAQLLCGCFAVDSDEHSNVHHSPQSYSRDLPSPDTTTTPYNEQPAPLSTHSEPTTTIPTFPVLRPLERGDEFIRAEDRVRTTSKRPPALKPLELGEASLFDRNQTTWLRQQKQSPSYARRPSIGAPTEFRRVELTESQRLSLVPMKLSPVVLNPSRRTSDASSYEQSPRHSSHDPLPLSLSSSRPSSLQDLRETPFQRATRQSLGHSLDSPASMPALTTPERAVTMQPIIEDVPPANTTTMTPAHPVPLSAQSSSSSMRSLRRYAHHDSSSVFSTPSRPSSSAGAFLSHQQQQQYSPASSIHSINTTFTTPLRSLPRLIGRKRSSLSATSARRSTSAESLLDWEKIDREILELNTIVEERRAEAANVSNGNGSRPQTAAAASSTSSTGAVAGGSSDSNNYNSKSPSDSLHQHIPAIAPGMAGRARSQTLSDIGSAFSKPLLAGSLPVAMNNRLSRPFTSMPDVPVLLDDDDDAKDPAAATKRRSSISTFSPLTSHDHTDDIETANDDHHHPRARSSHSRIPSWLSEVESSPSHAPNPPPAAQRYSNGTGHQGYYYYQHAYHPHHQRRPSSLATTTTTMTLTDADLPPSLTVTATSSPALQGSGGSTVGSASVGSGSRHCSRVLTGAEMLGVGGTGTGVAGAAARKSDALLAGDACEYACDDEGRRNDYEAAAPPAQHHPRILVGVAL